MTSDVPQRSTSVPSQAGPSEPSHEPPHEVAAEGSNSGHESPSASSSSQAAPARAEAAQKIAMVGMKVALPDMSPPSSPLTLRDRHSHWSPTEDEDGSPGEMDIVSWSEDDLGTVTSTSPSGRGEPSQKSPLEAHDHPLRGNPPSPPIWEQISPPTSSGQGASYGSSDTQNAQNYRGTKLSPSRPLIPRSSYYFAPPPPDAAFGTPPIGQIGIHHPREIVRIERDFSGGELPQFAPVYPLEFEGRLTPTQFLETINSINELLISAHSLRHSFVDNALSFFTLQLSRLAFSSHYEKVRCMVVGGSASNPALTRLLLVLLAWQEMLRLQHLIEDLNVQMYNPVGLNILWPRKVAFLFLEIEYY
ncbi:uncharacterized protein LAESUDRAFT_748573 [Laetiporus sulphureus 93-53]|uniref:Ras modification protein ERF4 n=1 Tax=Laetiporus sulphureus 93-53 TaxID=1314785 RepID=A0A165FGT0_9APHY|nr:uncharacterized protein LAESUDRAFT_748573 [Laetiporus sulphureus 93-53]KZT08947.1 hypothetical protein LAESUDRAFT_748573 [Laetiporus sulphureus 93-53]